MTNSERLMWALLVVCAFSLMFLVLCIIAGDANAAEPDTAAEQLLACVCSTSPNREACKDRRRADVTQTADTIRQVTREAGAPPIVAAILGATTCGESGAKAHPRGHNDGGTSAGWFQFKTEGEHARIFKLEHGRRLDPHNLREAARWYIARLRNSLRRAKVRCANRVGWGTAAGRVAKGPLVSPRQPAQSVAYIDPTGAADLVCRSAWRHYPAVPAVERCEPRGYGRRAALWGAGGWR